MVQQKLETPEELFQFQLRSAATMEQHSLEALAELQSAAPNPATTGISKQAVSLLDRTVGKLHNEVALVSALGNEHFEISTYQALILQARSLGSEDAVGLLSANLDQEVHTSQELLKALEELVA